jgi:tRNA (guanine37-N1)-methyltransferase
MRITFITLFPEFFEDFINHSIIKRSIEKNLVTIDVVNPRDFSKKNNVDDTVYGGGKGMLLMIEPIIEAIESVKTETSKVYLMGPRGPKYNQNKAKQLAKVDHLILISGHYEGVDSRIKYFIDGEISIGDYILTGGELPSMVIADSVIRLIDGVIQEQSHLNESFSNDLLEHDHFTKPVNFRGYEVPEVLLNGNHKLIDEYRDNSSQAITLQVKLETEKEKNNGY